MSKPQYHARRNQPYQYPISEVEAKYRIKINPDKVKAAEISEKVKANGGFCPCRIEKIPENRCLCEQFKNRDSEGFCKCRLYYKESRTAKEVDAYTNSKFSWDKKKEAEIEKEVIKEEKKAKAAIAFPDEEIE
jgi:hypothetical protein